MIFHRGDFFGGGSKYPSIFRGYANKRGAFDPKYLGIP